MENERKIKKKGKGSEEKKKKKKKRMEERKIHGRVNESTKRKNEITSSTRYK